MRLADSSDTPTWHVFISHTSELRKFPDKASYVAAVERAISAAGQAIVDMADFPAADQPPAELCRERVQGCDVYVGVLGTRYGSPVPDKPEVSYTEFEFSIATEEGMARLVFLLDTKAGNVGIPVEELIDLEFGARQEEFRRRVQKDSGLTVRFFSNPPALEQLVERSLRELAERRLQTGTEIRRGQVAAQRKPVQLAPQPPLLPGREALLAELHARLAESGGPEPRTVVLCGLGGTGKTSVAVEYAYRHLDEVRVAWQFPAEDATVLAARFRDLANQLGPQVLAGSPDPVASVHAVLASFPAPWLLIFDNVPDRASIAPFQPPAGPGRVLITSQNPDWPSQAVDVRVLDTDIAARFLVDRTGDQDWQAARNLAEALGGLPLALEQAAAYVQATGATLARYLAWFQKRQAELLSRGQPAGYGKTVVSTWSLAFQRLEESAPTAAGLLRLLAFYAPEAIPLDLLLRDRPGLAEELGPQVAAVLLPLLRDELARGDAIAALRRYSLITPVSGLVSVHRLVQAVTVAQLPPGDAEAWRHAAGVLIEAALPADPRQPPTWADCAALLPHAQAALADDANGMSVIGEYLSYTGSYAAARALHQRIADARERLLGREHPQTLKAHRDLAYVIGLAGDPEAARNQVAVLLPVLVDVLGPEDQQTRVAQADLARWTGEAGDAAGARDQFAALLPARERLLGPENRETLAARAGLAGWTGQAGDAAGARDQFAALLPVAGRALGAENTLTLTAQAALARWTGEAGDAAGARDQFAALLPARERLLGPENPETLAVRASLAGYTGDAGDPVGARDQFAALLPVIERVLGPNHQQARIAQVSLARWTGQAGDAAGARDQFAALLLVMERVLGPEHHGTLTVRASLAGWTGEAGDAAGARDQFAALLPVMERVLGPENPTALGIRGDFARWTGQAGDAAGARDQFAALLLVMERVLGPEHHGTLTVRASLAGWTGEAGDAAGARDQFAALLPVMERVLGPENPTALGIRGDFARWTGQAGDAAGARDQFAALLPVMERVLGPEHHGTLTVRASLAGWTRQVGRRRRQRRQK